MYSQEKVFLDLHNILLNTNVVIKYRTKHFLVFVLGGLANKEIILFFVADKKKI